ncbi:MAG TPA: metallophosphoesterase [Bradyrhizobium sp.]|nr:metallophosphoesterase [Bradyrhizobium sp.]
MKILAFSDLHRDAATAEAIVNESRGADVVVGAGDFASCGLGHEDTLDVLRRIAVPFVLVPGNHDDLGALRAACADWPLAHLLHGQSVVIGGVAFFGIGLGSGVIDPEPWNKVLDEAEAAQMLARCPAQAVLVSHSPPHGIADRQKDGRHAGSAALRDAIVQHRPSITICGHVHNAWGQSGTIGQTAIHNIGPKPRWFVV